MIPNLIMSVSALPKTGKNHYAYTAPEPIRVYCFNGGADFVATKFPSKAIDVRNFHMPIVEDEDKKWALPVWEEFRSQYKKDIEGGAYSTYVFDTATEVENICQQSVLEEQQDVAEERNKSKKKLATNEYLARNLRMKALFDMAKNAGANLISLQYLKDEWIRMKGAERAEQTGNLVMDGWKRTESQADINLEMTTKTKTVIVDKRPVEKKISTTRIVSNRFDRDLDGKVFDDTTWDEIVALLFGESGA